MSGNLQENNRSCSRCDCRFMPLFYTVVEKFSIGRWRFETRQLPRFYENAVGTTKDSRFFLSIIAQAMSHRTLHTTSLIDNDWMHMHIATIVFSRTLWFLLSLKIVIRNHQAQWEIAVWDVHIFHIQNQTFHRSTKNSKLLIVYL